MTRFSISLSVGLFTLSVMLSLTVTAQTLVNRAWVAQYGLPDTVPLTRSSSRWE